MRADWVRAVSSSLSLFAMGCCPAFAAPTLVAIGPDSIGAERVLTQILPVGARFDLGDGSQAFNGGLAYRALDHLLYAISSDGSGTSSLVSFAPEAPATALATLAIGVGFTGGLAVNSASNALYAIASDVDGQSSLYQIDPSGGSATDLGILGLGYFGGLTYDSVLGSLFAISSDTSGLSRSLQRIDLSGAEPAAHFLFHLGDGSLNFNGGLAYDESAGRFVVIGSDSFGVSTLFSFDRSAASSLAVLDSSIGVGFSNVGLMFSPALGPGGGRSIPEPPTFLLIVLPIWAWIRSSNRFSFRRFRLEV